MIVLNISSDWMACNLSDVITQTVGEILQDEKGFSAAVFTEDIAKHDYILTPGRYVGIVDVEDDGEPFEEKMARLTGELSELFAESRKAEDEIRSQLKSVGFEI